MCNCTNTSGFAQAMQNAVAMEKKTGKAQAVFTLGGQSYFGEKEAVSKQSGICCYYLTSGEEILVPKQKSSPKKAKEEPKKEA